jgi:pimeloyl-ACP methyl ester carboxylesterase
MRSAVSFLLPLLLLAGACAPTPEPAPEAPAAEAPVADPVVADPATIDVEYPPAMRELSFESSGSKLNGLIYLANGPGPHPTVALLHGYAGNERNLDLAQAMRRAGFNVLYFNYRGSWGSGGEFSASNAVADVAAALDTLRERAVEYRVDRERLILVGHSFGGFTAALGTLDDPEVRCLGFIAGANLGAFGVAAVDNPEMRAMLREGLGADMDYESGPIKAQPEAAAADIVEHAARFDLRQRAPEFVGRPVMLVAGERDEQADMPTHHDPFLAALRDAGHDGLTEFVYDDDHYFSAHRVALARAVVNWLRSDCLASD